MLILAPRSRHLGSIAKEADEHPLGATLSGALLSASRPGGAGSQVSHETATQMSYGAENAILGEDLSRRI